MNPVEVGLYDSEYAQILSGLSGDELVVSTWSSNLYEGAKIRLRGEADEESEGKNAPGGPDDGTGANAERGNPGGEGRGEKGSGRPDDGAKGAGSQGAEGGQEERKPGSAKNTGSFGALMA